MGKSFRLNMSQMTFFSNKMMGNGFAIKNHDGNVYSPVDGTIVSIFPTLHAIGLEDKQGNSLLIHMGIDTVDLKGAPFTLSVKEGQTIKKGDLLATIDTHAIKAANKDDMVIVLAVENFVGNLLITQGNVDTSTEIYQF